MAEQEFVYTIHGTGTHGRNMGNVESVVNEHASEGWRLADTVEQDGTTVGLVFEREL
jgi:hypothetical protein